MNGKEQTHIVFRDLAVNFGFREGSVESIDQKGYINYIVCKCDISNFIYCF